MIKRLLLNRVESGSSQSSISGTDDVSADIRSCKAQAGFTFGNVAVMRTKFTFSHITLTARLSIHYGRAIAKINQILTITFYISYFLFTFAQKYLKPMGLMGYN